MIELNKIYNEFCEITIRDRIPDDFINLVVTSPPYNVDLGNNKYKHDGYIDHNDNMVYDEYLDWLKCVFDNLYNKMKDDGRICINIGNTENGSVVNAFDLSTIMQQIGYHNYTTIIWNKHQTGNRTSWGSWMSPSCPSFPTPFEYILVFYKKSKKLLHKGQTDLMKQEFINWSLPLWEFSGETKDVKHPAPFPFELPKRCIKLFSYIDDIVYDPFSGSGTTAMTCNILRRKWIASEKTKEYYDNSIERLNNLCKFKF